MGDILIGLTLDRSGSMSSLWEEAEAGFNRFKNEQAELDGHAWMILTVFDDEVDQVYYAWNCKDIPDLPEVSEWDGDPIRPRGLTALYDAVRATTQATDTWLNENPWFDGQVLQVIITDGYENASETRATFVKGMIAEKEKKGWEFVYLAANVDAWATGQSMGVSSGSTMQYQATYKGVSGSYSHLSSATTRMRSSESSTGDFFEEDEQTAG